MSVSLSVSLSLSKHLIEALTQKFLRWHTRVCIKDRVAVLDFPATDGYPSRNAGN